MIEDNPLSVQGISERIEGDPYFYKMHDPNQLSKHHTIRAGNRWKAGDMASLRIWSGRPYASKQIEFAKVKIVNVWPVNIYMFGSGSVGIPTGVDDYDYLVPLCDVAKNDGLECKDFVDWFKIGGTEFHGQIICWTPNINY